VLRRVVLDLETYRQASAARLATVLMDLVTTAVAERASRAELLPVESRERTLLLRVHAFIEQHLGEADLSPGIVAAAHHVSVRYLHRLFEAQDTTVAAWIRLRHLERCRRDLADPAFGHRSGQRRGGQVGCSGLGAFQPAVPACLRAAARGVPPQLPHFRGLRSRPVLVCMSAGHVQVRPGG
jgi:AraC-like DNA-binding protein